MMRQSSFTRLQKTVQVPPLEAHNTPVPVVRKLPKPYILTDSRHAQLEVFSSLLYCQPFVGLHIASIAHSIAAYQVVTLNIINKPVLRLKTLDR